MVRDCQLASHLREEAWVPGWPRILFEALKLTSPPQGFSNYLFNLFRDYPSSFIIWLWIILDEEVSSGWFHSKLTPILHPFSSSCPPPHDNILCASSLRRIWSGSLAASLLYLHIKELWLPPLCFKVFSFQDIWKSLILWPPTFVIFSLTISVFGI